MLKETTMPNQVSAKIKSAQASEDGSYVTITDMDDNISVIYKDGKITLNGIPVDINGNTLGPSQSPALLALNALIRSSNEYNLTADVDKYNDTGNVPNNADAGFYLDLFIIDVFKNILIPSGIHNDITTFFPDVPPLLIPVALDGGPFGNLEPSGVPGGPPNLGDQPSNPSYS